MIDIGKGPQPTTTTEGANHDNLKNLLPGAAGGRGIQIYDNKNNALATDNAYYYFDGPTLKYFEKAKDVEGSKTIDEKVMTFAPDGSPLDVIDKTKYKDLDARVKDYQGKTNELKKITGTDIPNAKTAYELYRQKKQAYYLVSTLMDTFGFKKFMSAAYWTDKWGPGKYVTAVADVLDPQRWSNSLCNPDNGLLYAGGNPEGTVYSCSSIEGSGCRLVLTYGAEYQEYYIKNSTSDKTRYLYTVSYLVGPATTDVPYNIEFKGLIGKYDSKAKSPLMGYNSSKYIVLPAGQLGQPDQKAKAFLLDYQYSQICFIFQKDFPDKGDGPSEKCRSIKENVFNTGKPMSEEQMNAQYGAGFTGTTHNSGGFME